ncbi:MAG: hypothetical protein U1F43_31495 [Myxococcota bacterium]
MTERGPLWRTLVAEPSERVLPWLGGRVVHAAQRSWRLAGASPPEHGWWRFRVDGGRRAELVPSAEPASMPLGFEVGAALVSGYLVGDRLVPDGARVAADAARLGDATRRVHLVEPGLGRFARASAFAEREGALVFVRQELPLGPEPEVEAAYQDRRADLDPIAGVTPALDLAFRWSSRERQRIEDQREAARRAREEAERQQAMVQAIGSGEARRELAAHDFEAAARAALALSGAELLDARPSFQRGEVVVSYRFRGRRLECVVSRATLGIVDAGVCLLDGETGERGDARFTLESLPGVIGQALDEDRLVVWRHV